MIAESCGNPLHTQLGVAEQRSAESIEQKGSVSLVLVSAREKASVESPKFVCGISPNSMSHECLCALISAM